MLSWISIFNVRPARCNATCCQMYSFQQANHRFWRCDPKRRDRSGVAGRTKSRLPAPSPGGPGRGEPRRKWESRAHVRWLCRCHAVSIPKYRKEAIVGTLRKEIGGVFRGLCEPFGGELVEGHALPDHGHMYLSGPPECSIANARGKRKGPSAILIH